jgi:ABC-type amino acid transport substrate-binding protein
MATARRKPAVVSETPQRDDQEVRRNMKKLALCVAQAVMATGAVAKERKSLRAGLDAGSPPFGPVAPGAQMDGTLRKFEKQYYDFDIDQAR